MNINELNKYFQENTQSNEESYCVKNILKNIFYNSIIIFEKKFK